MILKTSIINYFGKSKVMLATLATVVTFSITLYNQFRPHKATEISGIIAANSDSTLPVDAIVRISSPIQAQTETDANGRFKFKFENLQSDTFLLIVQNRKTNSITKQNEYVNKSVGRTDIIVLFNSDIKDVNTYTSNDKSDPVRRTNKRPTIKKIFRGIFH
ncbi:MAG: hypothetical protein ABIN89_23865 [Chitinophagaceae bacterium]